MKSAKANNTGGMLLLALLLGGSAGCRTINRGITEAVLERGPSEKWHVEYGSRIRYVLTDESLNEMAFEGSWDANDLSVRYQRGLAAQARCVADTTAGLLGQVEERTGVSISTRSALYLLRFDSRPQSFDISLSVEPNVFPLPLFIQIGEESCEAILAQNRSYPYLLVHELVETSLAGGGQSVQVLPDLAWGVLGLNLHFNNYTRWFRDGLANYAGYVAYEVLARQMPSQQRLYHRQTLLHTNPFSYLDQVGARLFSWPQSGGDMESERAYYNAALGLFLLMADTFGEQAIRAITAEVAKRETVDGRDLIEIANRVLKTDVRRLARDFDFPQIGVELERMSPALALNEGLDLREGLFVKAVTDDSAAQRAGLRKRDVITAAGSSPVANHLDFELGVFRARKQPTVPLTVERADVGTLTLELPLREPKKTPPAQRRKS